MDIIRYYLEPNSTDLNYVTINMYILPSIIHATFQSTIIVVAASLKKHSVLISLPISKVKFSQIVTNKSTDKRIVLSVGLHDRFCKPQTLPFYCEFAQFWQQ